MTEAITWTLALYCGVGFFFAAWFVFWTVGRLDAAAAGAGLGFRLLILPGALALWPVLLMRVGSKR